VKKSYSLLLTLLILLAGCGVEGEPDISRQENGPAEVCEIVANAAPLAAGLEESSGVVASRAHPGVLWSHNDSGWPAEIIAIDSTGARLGTVRIAGAASVDWEDIAFGPCPGGECLYVGDIGDNNAERGEIAVYRFPEPQPRDGEVRAAERFAMRYPDGARDAEGLFVLPSGELFVVSKGRESAAALYRYPPPLRAGETVTLQRVAPLSAAPLELMDQLTGADATRDGGWVVIRAYQSLRFHRAGVLVAGDTVPELRFPLDEVDEVQGEGVALRPDGTVILTGEGGFEQEPGTIVILRCRLP
jgi:hypothetical protein